MVTRPIGLSRDLPPKRVMRASIEGLDIVVWRASDGTIAAWDNRCPHRGMALSHGFVRGTSLACLYHGWHYSATGQCNHIPAHPDLEPPETIRTKAYSVVETSGVIWVSSDAGAEANLLDFAPLRSFIVDGPEAALHAACLTVPLQGHKCAAADDDIYSAGDMSLAVLSNPVGDTTRVTVLAPKDINALGLRALSRWCEAVRRVAEMEAGA
ncbi:MAG: Rieske (2Fe-2S) protein [Pseudomonadota bacterium]